MEAALQAAISSPSDRLKQALKLAPRLLDVYFSIALHDVNQSLKCALIPMLLDRYSKLFPDKFFTYEVRKRLLNFILAAFHQSPEFVAILKKPIVDRLGEAYDSPEKTELALQLCWAIGEHGGGGASHKDAARELFESLKLLLYENLSSSLIGQYTRNLHSLPHSIWLRCCHHLTDLWSKAKHIPLNHPTLRGYQM
nr:AP-5 complex subunit zeta-1 [Tanacetum cinerariifolium]